MYGIALEAMAQAHQWTRRKEMPAYMKRASDWIYAQPERVGPREAALLPLSRLAVMLTPGLAYIAETSGDRKYFDTRPGRFPPPDRSAATGQPHEAVRAIFPQLAALPWYLSVECPLTQTLAAEGRKR